MGRRAHQRERVEQEPLLTVDELADFLGYHPESVRRLARADVIPGFRVGHAWRFKLSAVIERCELRTALQHEAARQQQQK
jgi:excisionase family DNA binding protein